jgi:hypothetical protein
MSVNYSAASSQEQRARLSGAEELLADGGSAPRLQPAVYAAAGLSLLAALSHLWVMPHYYAWWWGYGVLYLVCALAQGFFSAFLWRWPQSRVICLAGIWGNLAVIVLYVVSHTWGIPFGAGVGHIEDPDVVGMITAVAQVGIVIALVGQLGGLYRKVMVNSLLVAGVLLWGLRLLGVLP